MLFKTIIQASTNLEEQKSLQCFLQCAALTVNKTGTCNDEYSNDTTFGRIVSSGLSDHWLQLTEGEIPEELAPIAEIARQIVAPDAEQKFYKLYLALRSSGYSCYSGILPTTLQDLAEMQRQFQVDCDDALCKIVINHDEVHGISNCTPETCGFTEDDTPAEKANKVRRWLQENRHVLEGVTNLDFCDSGMKVLPPEIAQYFPHLQNLNLYINQLQGIDLHKFPHLLDLNISINQLETIDLQNLHRLTTLKLSNNRLQRIDLQNLTNLRYVDLGNNQLKLFNNLQDLFHLSFLSLGYNELQTIELQNLPVLEFLDLEGNKLEFVFLRDLPNFTKIYLEGNPIKSVDLQNLGKTGYLDLPTYQKMLLLAQDAAFLEISNVTKNLFLLREISLEELDKRIWELAGSPMDGNPFWGRDHRYDDAERFFRALPIDDKVKNTFDQLGEGWKDRVYGKVWELAGKPEGDDKWGEHHVFEDSYFFYSALGHELILSQALDWASNR
ncbi:MAG: leucine-rich repeat domain-containing protein [Verrucomicrobia bacterium]|nr:leucine-rich repeat domain-containing protein [Verrucomicrobiota bacterium]